MIMFLRRKDGPAEHCRCSFCHPSYPDGQADAFAEIYDSEADALADGWAKVTCRVGGTHSYWLCPTHAKKLVELL